MGNAFRAAVRRSGVRGAGRLSLHSLRHGYASLLIAKGLNVLFVSRQLGHANPNVTLSVYAHLFARREHGDLARQALEASYQAMARAGGKAGGGLALAEPGAESVSADRLKGEGGPGRERP
ncbi:MAG: hypothetical protein A2X51_00190 [Candidatus Rokubacteria bacterium GWC2_70_24]|nr:MAG: hypothetical protein A2X51_00190 [Candidatus Rokubacteria bacterium GWC2_70_24]OGK90503.1 MAG: hypothetical protein A2X50_12845 [Candidatus Rokubacteria bacterium GWF2_70_14]